LQRPVILHLLYYNGVTRQLNLCDRTVWWLLA
jgi:hypothetical protein